MGQSASERREAGVRRRLGGWVIVLDGTRGVATRATEGTDADARLGRSETRLRERSRRVSGACLVEPVSVLGTVVLMLVAYLAGSIPVGSLVARYSGGTDPRTVGSGRTGGTNALRTLGRGRAAIVVIGDLLKGALPVVLARIVTGDPLVEVLCGASAVAGAIWSVFAGFRSGRGVATGVGTMLVIQPVAVLLATPVFIGVILLTRYVSLGSLIGSAAMFPAMLLVLLVVPETPLPYVLYSAVGAAHSPSVHSSGFNTQPSKRSNGLDGGAFCAIAVALRQTSTSKRGNIDL